MGKDPTSYTVQDLVMNTVSSGLILIFVAGSGKSVLTAMAIDYVCDKHGELRNAKPIRFAYHFFKSNQEHKNLKRRDIVSRLLKLLASARPLPSKVQEFYKERSESSPPKYEELVDLLCSCAIDSSAFVFFDAFDEATTEQRKATSDLIRRLVNCDVRVFLTSQPQFTPRVQEISEFRELKVVANAGDLETYIAHELRPEWPQLPEEEYTALQRRLIIESGGM